MSLQSKIDIDWFSIKQTKVYLSHSCETRLENCKYIGTYLYAYQYSIWYLKKYLHICLMKVHKYYLKNFQYFSCVCIFMIMIYLYKIDVKIAWSSHSWLKIIPSRPLRHISDTTRQGNPYHHSCYARNVPYPIGLRLARIKILHIGNFFTK